MIDGDFLALNRVQAVEYIKVKQYMEKKNRERRLGRIKAEEILRNCEAIR